jgi:hypothetical protein
MKIILLLTFLGYSIFAQSQLQLKDITSYGTIGQLYQYGGEIYCIPSNSNTILEIDRETYDILEHNVYSDFQIVENRASFLMDSFIVVLNYSQNDPDFREFLSLNLKTKEQIKFDLNTVLRHYVVDDDNGLQFFSFTQSTEKLFFNLGRFMEAPYSIKSYHPLNGLDSLDLSEIPREPGEYIKDFKWADSYFCAFTNLNRFVIWPEDNPSEYDILPYADKKFKNFYAVNEGQFYFLAEDLDLENSDSLYAIDVELNIENIAEEFALSSQKISKVDFVGDSICISYYNSKVILVDRSTGVKSTITKFSYGSNINPYKAYVDRLNGGVFITTLMPFRDPYSKVLHLVNKDETYIDIETNPKYFISNDAIDRPWINRNNDVFFFKENSYNIFDGVKYHEIEIEHEWFTDYNVAETKYSYIDPSYEDEYGNIYCVYRFDYGPGLIEDVIYFIKFRPDYTHVFLTEEEFNKIVNQERLILEGKIYKIVDGQLIVIDENQDFKTIAVDDAIRHVHGYGKRVIFSTETELFLMNTETYQFRSIKEYSSTNSPEIFTNDAMGNLFYRTSGYLQRIAHNSYATEYISPPDTVFPTTGLYHDRNGNIYGSRTGKASYDDNINFGYIIYYNGFNWDLTNNVTDRVLYSPGDYHIKTGTNSTSNLMHAFFRSSAILVECPCREIKEIKNEYYIHDTTEILRLEVESDLSQVLWDNESSDFYRSINKPGKYWVKVLNENGCSNVKTFEVKVSPTSNHNNKNIFYYSNSNSYPLILDDSLKGDLFIYDLKGATIQEFPNYQNDWIPESSLTNSMMVYAIYDEDELKFSGRIFFF